MRVYAEEAEVRKSLHGLVPTPESVATGLLAGLAALVWTSAPTASLLLRALGR